MDECMLAKKRQYQEIISELYKGTVFVSLEELILIHKEHDPENCHITINIIKDYIRTMAEEPCVAYVLKPGVCSRESHCCNGIRYGNNGDYISLPQLPSHVWVPF